MKRNNINKLVAYLSLVTIVLFIITGLGITQFKIMGMLTFGLLTKPLSFKIHSYLIYPLIIFVVLHLYYSCNLLNFLKKK